MYICVRYGKGLKKTQTVRTPPFQLGSKNTNGGHCVVQLASISASRKCWLQAERADFTFNVIIRSCPCFKANRILIVNTIYLNWLFLVWYDNYIEQLEENLSMSLAVFCSCLCKITKYSLGLPNPTFHGSAPHVIRNVFSLPDGHFQPRALGVHLSPLFVYVCQLWYWTCTACISSALQFLCHLPKAWFI